MFISGTDRNGSKRIMIVHLVNTLASGGAEKLMLEEVQSSKAGMHVIVVLRDVSSELSSLVNSDKLLIERMSFRTLIRFFRIRKTLIIKSYLYRSHIFSLLFWIFGFHILWVYHSTIYSGKLSFVQRVVRYLSYFVPTKQVFVSEHAKNTHMKHRFSKKNICVVHNGIKIPTLNKDIVSSTNRVAFLGRNSKVKNVDLLFRTIQCCIRLEYGLTFFLYGEDFQGSNDDIISRIEKYDISEHVKLMGYSQNIFDIPASFGLVVSTSIDESFGLALVEAAANGTPIASVNLSVMEELFPNFDINSYSTSAEKNAKHWMKMLSKDLAYKRRLQKNAIVYDINLMYKRYQKIYRDVIDG